jgi:D-glycero-alpha-D-manno-heptose 1-phosphate guanylyltransferase
MEAIVLAGGRGTRLASVIRDIPKAMAPVGSRPFLELLLRRLKQSGFTRVILSVGYLQDIIRAHFGPQFEGIELTYAVEEEPLGTGGATLRALALGCSSPVFVLNGDTLVDMDFGSMLSRHVALEASVSIAVVDMADCSRFGRVHIEEDRITGYAEKGQTGPGKISAGVYLMNQDLFEHYRLPIAFSLEQDFFVPHIKQLRPLAFPASGYFIDIGIPEDLARIQNELL